MIEVFPQSLYSPAIPVRSRTCRSPSRANDTVSLGQSTSEFRLGDQPLPDKGSGVIVDGEIFPVRLSVEFHPARNFELVLCTGRCRNMTGGYSPARHVPT